MNNRVKIFVVAHKPFGMPEGKVLADYENPAILLGLKNDGIL